RAPAAPVRRDQGQRHLARESGRRPARGELQRDRRRRHAPPLCQRRRVRPDVAAPGGAAVGAPVHTVPPRRPGRRGRGRAAGAAGMVRGTAVAAVPVLAAAGAILYAARAPLLGFLFRRGEMDAGGVAQMVAVFPYYLLALPSFGVLLVLYRATVAVKDSRILPAMGVLNAGLTVVLDVLLFQLWGLIGIAAARAIAATAVAAAVWIRLQRLLRPAS